MHPVARGLLAGAAGTAALNLSTYLDMLVRGRGASGLPAEVAGRVAERTGIDLGEPDRRPNREDAAGALLGYVTGLGIAAAYGVLRGERPRRRGGRPRRSSARRPWPAATYRPRSSG